MAQQQLLQQQMGGSCPAAAAAAMGNQPKLLMDSKTLLLDGSACGPGVSVLSGGAGAPATTLCTGVTVAGGGGKRGSKSSIFGVRSSSVNEEGYSRPTFVQTTPNVSTHGVST